MLWCVTMAHMEHDLREHEDGDEDGDGGVATDEEDDERVGAGAPVVAPAVPALDSFEQLAGVWDPDEVLRALHLKQTLRWVFVMDGVWRPLGTITPLGASYLVGKCSTHGGNRCSVFVRMQDDSDGPKARSCVLKWLAMAPHLDARAHKEKGLAARSAMDAGG